MNRPKRPNKNLELPFRAEDISVEELTRFLKNLASIYKSPRTGNPALSNALLKLANSVALHGLVDTKPKTGRTTLRRNVVERQDLTSLDAQAVERFLADNGKSKDELIALGCSRFSIPRAKLIKLSSENVRSTIKSALLHENSLKILSQEAHQGGSKRQS